jgi:hypothetical protein
MLGFKGFDCNWRCANNFQYAVGETREIDKRERIKLCCRGLHFCKHLFSVFSYYPADDVVVAHDDNGKGEGEDVHRNKYAVVLAKGDISDYDSDADAYDNDKLCCSSMKVLFEIPSADLKDYCKSSRASNKQEWQICVDILLRERVKKFDALSALRHLCQCINLIEFVDKICMHCFMGSKHKEECSLNNMIKKFKSKYASRAAYTASKGYDPSHPAEKEAILSDIHNIVHFVEIRYPLSKRIAGLEETCLERARAILRMELLLKKVMRRKYNAKTAEWIRKTNLEWP